MIMWVRFRLPMCHCIAHKTRKVKLDFHPCDVDIGRASCMVIQEKGHAGNAIKKDLQCSVINGKSVKLAAGIRSAGERGNFGLYAIV